MEFFVHYHNLVQWSYNQSWCWPLNKANNQMLIVGDGQSGKFRLLCWRHFFKSYVEDFEFWNISKMNGEQLSCWNIISFFQEIEKVLQREFKFLSISFPAET